MKSPAKPMIMTVALTGLVTGLIGIAAPQAQAATCSSRSTRISDGSAAMSITVQRNCSDGRSRVFGSVEDIKCDARSAYGTIKFWNGDNLVWFRREFPSDTNGCNTSASFSYSSTNPDPRIYAYVVAYNSGPTQSSGAGAYV